MAMLTIGAVAERTGLAVSAIRHYEEMGLVNPGRNAGGQRRYHLADLRRLSFVMVAQRCGFTLPEIAQVLAGLPESRTPTKADWARIGRGFKRELDVRIAAMEQLRERLDSCIGCGCLSLKACKLYNAQDMARRNGPGPRWLMGDSPDPI